MRKEVLWFSVLLMLVAVIITPSQAQNPNLYRNTIYAFSILFPDGWKQRSGQTPHTLVIAESSSGDSIVIQAWQLPRNVTLDDYSESELRGMIRDNFNKLKLTYTDIVLDNSGITHISNKKSIWMSCTYSIKQAFADTKVTMMHYQVYHERKMVQIICGSPVQRYKQVQGTLLNSVRSFIFEDPSWYDK